MQSTNFATPLKNDMPYLFKSAYELMGKVQTDPILDRLILVLQEQPERRESDTPSRLFNFTDIQLALVSHLRGDQWVFVRAFMTVEVVGSIKEKVALHGGNLPFGILPTDTPDIVAFKMNQQQTDFGRSYRLPMADLVFGFDADTERINHWMVSLR